MISSFSQQSAHLAFTMFFSMVKAVLVAVVLLCAVLVWVQSRVAPVSARLLTAYALEYAVSTFKPYRGYFPEPYLIHVTEK